MVEKNDERLAIRDESYRVVHAEVCRTCRHWHASIWSDIGACRVISSNAASTKDTSPMGTCDLWEGKPGDQ